MNLFIEGIFCLFVQKGFDNDHQMKSLNVIPTSTNLNRHLAAASVPFQLFNYFQVYLQTPNSLVHIAILSVTRNDCIKQMILTS